MADDSNTQNRLNNTAGDTNGGQNSDPLAELARLIGQNDPFSDFSRDARAQQAAQQRPQPNDPAVAGPAYNDARGRSGALPGHGEAGVPTFIQAGQDRFRDAAYADQGQMPPPSSDFDFDTEPKDGGRKFMTLTVVAALAVVGIAGAFGYRFIFGSSGSNAPPPVIRANPEPTKVPPPVANSDATPGKSTYDRVGDRGQGERVVAREEAPVDVNNLTRPGVGRNPPPTGPAGQWTTAPAPNAPPTGPMASATPVAPSAMGEPKRVRTVTIRPDQTDANMPPNSLTAPPAQSPLPPARSAAAPPPPPPPAAAPVQQRAPVAVAPPAPPARNAPLSLGDDSSLSLPRTLNTPTAAPAQPRQIQRQAAAPPPPTQRAPQPSAQVAAPKGGGYLVQVSSQRNESEAQAALRAVQSKFSSVVGGQQSTIRRVELGERGTFYRAMIGPYASRDQATQLCANLKAAGGDCIVQAN